MITNQTFAFCLVLLLAVINPGDIATINELKKKAQEAYEDQDYVTASYNYQVLMDSLGVTDPAIKLNLAHCYYQLKNETDAISYYRSLCTDDVENDMRSVAYQQLGVINADKKDLKNALEDFKSSLRANPNNEDARYNYEVVKRKLKEEEEKKKEDQQQDKQEQDQKKDQQKQDQKQEQKDNQSEQENQEQQQQEQENKEKQEQQQKEQQQQQEQQQSEEEKRKQQEQQQQQSQAPEIERARAEQILKSMQEQEKQYFQQLKKKGKKKSKNGPDW